MQLIPIQPVPSQQLQVVLGGQNCQIALYQKPTGLFFDLQADGNPICAAVIAQDSNPLNPITYSSFQGNLYLVDTQGNTAPVYTGLGSRYKLIYVTAAEYVSL